MNDAPNARADQDEDEDDAIDLDLLTEHEKERAKHQAVIEQNDRRERAIRARRNRARGLAKPKPGDLLYVSIARGIHQRNRAGLTFPRRINTKVEVVDARSDEELVLMRQRPEYASKAIVNVAGAERILEDDALICRQSAQSDEDLISARSTIDAQNTEIARLRAELELRSAAKKDARRKAAGYNDAAPTRLAAAKVASQRFDEAQAAAGTSKAPDLFSGPGAAGDASLTELIKKTEKE